MLVAVRMGREQPRRLWGSSRRSILRLRLRSWRFIVAFTRKPSLLGWLRSRSNLQTPQKDEGFRAFLRILPLPPLEGPLIQGLGGQPRSASTHPGYVYESAFPTGLGKAPFV